MEALRTKGKDRRRERQAGLHHMRLVMKIADHVALLKGLRGLQAVVAEAISHFLMASITTTGLHLGTAKF
jgi:hypothetical protein